MAETISQFRGNYRFLSNFHPAQVSLYGVSYPTVEHAYQAAKTEDLAERDRVLWLIANTSSGWRGRTKRHTTPGEAKRAGRAVTLRPGWSDIRLAIMLDLLRQKFTIPHLKELILGTIGMDLVEGNRWHDNFWGSCILPHCLCGPGNNHLGKLLQQVRTEVGC